MKKSIRRIGVAVCLIVCSLCLFSCNGKSTALGVAPNPQSLDYEVRNRQSFKDITAGAEAFAAKFADCAYADFEGDSNVVFSPISVFSALAFAAECAAGQTETQILNAIGVSKEILRSDFANLYNALSYEYKSGYNVTSRVKVSNSVWINDGVDFNNDCINTLAYNYYCNSFKTDFANDNENANKAVRKFIKDNTSGLIDQNLGLSSDTLFALICTLYLKDIWNYAGDDLPFADGDFTFKDKKGNESSVRLLQGDYCAGRAVETETFFTFYTRTLRGYKIKFILPKDGYEVGDVFNKQNIAYVNGIEDYQSEGQDGKNYFTRCLFPEFSAAYSADISQILKVQFGINDLFDVASCNLSSLTSDSVYCGEIRHMAKLKVNKKGVEGAAAVVMPGDTAPGPSERICSDFIVNRAFGFILTDRYDTTLFSGVIHYAN